MIPQGISLASRFNKCCRSLRKSLLSTLLTSAEPRAQNMKERLKIESEYRYER